jgi:hypothetical protein
MRSSKFTEETAADLAPGDTLHLGRNDGGDPLASAAINACQNCGVTHGYLAEVWTDDGTKPLLCDDCAQEVRRLEKLADELAAASGCQDRQQILDTAETTAELVNRLRAHDMADCMGCASARVSVAADEQPVNSTPICRQGEVA